MAPDPRLYDNIDTVSEGESWMDAAPRIACPDCNGDGGWESDPHGYEPLDGSPHTHWINCRACDGDGWIEEE